MTDEDGDSATATVTITLPDDSPEVFEQAPITVDEDGLEGGIADGVDDVPGEDAEIDGTLNYDFGDDGAGDIDFASLNGTTVQATGDEGLQNLTSNANPITYVWEAGTHTLTGVANEGDDGEYDVFTLVVTDINTGEYTFTLIEQVDHPTGATEDLLGTEDDLVLNLPFTVTDFDGDTANGSLEVTIDDDSPVAEVADVATPTLVLDESPAPTGEDSDYLADPEDVINDGINDGISSVSADFTGNFVTPITFGADGPASEDSIGYSLVLTGSDVASGMYALDATDVLDHECEDTDGIGQGDEIVLNQLVDGSIVGTAGGITYFTISVDDNPESATFGEVTFSQSNNIWHGDDDDHDDSETLTVSGTTGEGEDEVSNSLVIEQTVTDADGDTASDAIN